MIPFLVALLLALVFLGAEDVLGPFAPLVKMAPVAVLGGLVFRSGPTAAGRLAASGLLIAAVADLVIEFSFVGGLIAFLLAHLFYIAAFTRVEPRLCLWRLVPVAVWAALALPILVGHAGSLAIPVLTYGVVILVMIWRAAAAVSVMGWNQGTIGFMGAVLFGASDTLLGYSRFVTPLPASNLLIMGTYWAAQTLIAVSFLSSARGLSRM